MKTNSAHLRWACILLVVLLLVAALSACNGTEENSEETARSASAPTQTPAPTQASDPTQTPEPTDTPAPTPTSEPTHTPAPAPESSRMTLEEYAAFCAEFDSGESTEEGEITYGEFSDGLGVLIGLLESVNPPQEVSDWHQALLASQRELKAAIDEYPGSKDDPIDLERFFTLIMAYHERLSVTIQEMDPALRDWLVAAGCIDEGMAAFAASAGGDEAFGGSEESEETERVALTVGVRMEGPLNKAGETDHFSFRAEEGKEYLIEATWEGTSSLRVGLTDGLTFSKIRERSRPPLQLIWSAPEKGNYELNVTPGSASEGGTVSYTLSVSINTQTPKPTDTPTPPSSPPQAASPTATVAPTAEPVEAVLPGPTNVQYAIEGAAIRVNWQTVEGADSYNVYHDAFFDSNCSLGPDGTPSFCQELATNVVNTSFLHTNPDEGENFYWVTACNQGGCSVINSESPAGPVVDRPGAPSAVTYAREGAAIRVSWQAVERADSYNVYHDAFFDSNCLLGPDGTPSFCQELATNVVDTNFLHTNPDGDENFYWVVACNQGGCSEIDSESPASEGEAGETG